jgi:hypothetical protein
MPLLSIALRRAAIGLTLILGGCGGPPWTLRSSPDSIALRWYSAETPAALADQIAQLDCARSDKSAELTQARRDGSAEIADFRCR